MLWEVIGKDPTRPEAYCKLWNIYIKEKKFDKCIDLCEKAFLSENAIDENEYMYENNNHRTLIIILNTKVAMKAECYVISLQKLQYQYSINTTQPILLYYYGKYICLCKDITIRNHFLCSGIGALFEALRSCHKSRYGKIYVRIINCSIG